MSDDTVEFSGTSLQSLSRAAEMFGVLSTPLRLQIIGALCCGEKNVSLLLEQIDASQSNMSRHLSVLYQAGVVARRRDRQQIFYRIADDSVLLVCKAVCSQIGSWKNERGLQA